MVFGPSNRNSKTPILWLLGFSKHSLPSRTHLDSYHPLISSLAFPLPSDLRYDASPPGIPPRSMPTKTQVQLQLILLFCGYLLSVSLCRYWWLKWASQSRSLPFSRPSKCPCLCGMGTDQKVTGWEKELWAGICMGRRREMLGPEVVVVVIASCGGRNKIGVWIWWQRWFWWAGNSCNTHDCEYVISNGKGNLSYWSDRRLPCWLCNHRVILVEEEGRRSGEWPSLRKARCLQMERGKWTASRTFFRKRNHSPPDPPEGI